MERLLKTNIKREKGTLYFCKSEADGYLSVYKATMARRKKKIDSVGAKDEKETD